MIEFQPGDQYANRKGNYTVVEVTPPTMKVRYEDGLEETLSIAIQQRILSNMALPPRTPEPPPRKRTGPSTPVKVETRAPAAPRASRSASAVGSSATATAPRTTAGATATRSRRAVAGPTPTTTLAQLALMTDKEQQKTRHDLLNATLMTPEGFQGLLDRSREAEHGRFGVLPVDQVVRLHASAPAPSPSDPEAFLAHSIAGNRAYLASEEQQILVPHFPFYEAGVERYVVDLLCYDEKGRRAMLVCANTKSTVRRWLWEALLDSLRNWAAAVATPGFADAVGQPLESLPTIVVLGPRSFWADNAPGAGARTDEVASGHALNRRLLAAMEDWARLSVLLLQVPDDWLRTADKLDHPSISPAPFSRGHAG